MNEIVVSVIIPVYNVERYLEKCIQSVLDNTYKLLEIILIDDGSTDSSGCICDRYEKNFTNITAVHKMNGGLSSARNEGLKYVKGKYILFIDSDDYISNDYIECLINEMNLTNVDVVQGNYEKVDENGNSLYIPNIHNAVYNTKNSILDAFFISHNIQVIAWGKLYKSNLFKNIHFMEGKNHEDNIFIADLIEQINSYACIDNLGYKYVQRTGSIVNSTFNEKKLDAIYATEYILEKCKEKWPNYAGYASILVCKACIYLYYNYLKNNVSNEKIKKVLINTYKTNFLDFKKTKCSTSKIDRIRFELFNICPRLTYIINDIFSKDKL